MSFGDLSKTIASHWEVMSAEEKHAYKTKTSNERKDFLNQLAIQQATFVLGNGGAGPGAEHAPCH